MRAFTRYILPCLIILSCALIISGFIAVQRIQQSLQPTPDEVRYQQALTAVADCQKSLKDCN